MPNLAGPALYHWFDGNFLRYGGPLTPGDLPVDNHELIALCAPRPVFIGGGAAPATGMPIQRRCMGRRERMFLAEVDAGPVYRLLGAKDLGTTEFPSMGTALIDGDLGFRQHQFGHTPHRTGQLSSISRADICMPLPRRQERNRADSDIGLDESEDRSAGVARHLTAPPPTAQPFVPPRCFSIANSVLMSEVKHDPRSLFGCFHNKSRINEHCLAHRSLSAKFILHRVCAIE